MKHIGVLGGSRFIGHHLTQALVGTGHRVTLFNRGRTAPPEPLPLSVRRVYGDRNRPGDLAAFMDTVYDVVFDLSGYVPAHVAPFLIGSHPANIGHYVFCSTSSVYRLPPPCPCHETAPRTKVAGTYGGDKARIEDLLIDAWRATGWPVTIVRPQGVFGPFDPAQAISVFSRLKHELPIVLGPMRGYKMNLLYVGDLVAAFLRIMESRTSHGQTYNVAGNDVTSQREFAMVCAQAADIEARIRTVDAWPYKHLPIGFSWPAYDLVVDNACIQRDLGIEFTPLAEGLAATWKWLQGDPAHLEPELLRGERHVREDGRVPLWVRACLRIDDVTSTSTVRRLALSPIAKLARRSWTLVRGSRLTGPAPGSAGSDPSRTQAGGAPPAGS